MNTKTMFRIGDKDCSQEEFVNGAKQIFSIMHDVKSSKVELDENANWKEVV